MWRDWRSDEFRHGTKATAGWRASRWRHRATTNQPPYIFFFFFSSYFKNQHRERERKGALISAGRGVTCRFCGVCARSTRTSPSGDQTKDKKTPAGIKEEEYPPYPEVRRLGNIFCVYPPAHRRSPLYSQHHPIVTSTDWHSLLLTTPSSYTHPRPIIAHHLPLHKILLRKCRKL